MAERIDIGTKKSDAIRKPKRQLAMVFDLNKCLGCQTCSISCKRQWTREEGMESMWWTIVNTMPGQGTPKHWESMGGGRDKHGAALPGRRPSPEEFGEAWAFNKDEVFHGGKGKATYLQPVNANGEAPTWGPNWDEDVGGGKYPNSHFFYLPRICNHCTHPACLEACPRGAINKRSKDGMVILNENRCRGYRYCMEACPYKRIYYNHVRNISQKCIFCFPRVDQGVAPACSRQCPGRMRFVGYLDDPSGPIHKLVHQWKVALPLHHEYGTEPNVFYIPPLSPPSLNAQGNIDHAKPRIPLAYLENLFGSRVGAVLELLEAEKQKKSKGLPSELMDTLIVYKWPNDIFPDLVQDPAKIERG